jgi:lipopolysaccharide export system permease protein
VRRSPAPLGVLDRYLLGEFTRYYVLALGGFTGFVLLFDAFEKLDTFIDYKATPVQVLSYYWNVLPYRALLVAPVAPLLATFLTLGGMTRYGEMTSIKAAGISLYRALVPLYAMGVLLAALSFLVAEGIMPEANRRARDILQTDIKGTSRRNLGSRIDVTYLGRENRFYVINRYDIGRDTMVEPMIQEFAGEHLVRRLDAEKAFYREGTWVLVSGVERRFVEGGDEVAAPFDTLVADFPEVPSDFAKEETRPDEMSFPDLRRYTARVRESGASVDRYRTELHLRLSFPLANVIVILIASSLAVQVRRGGVALGFGFSLAIAFAYWSLIRAGQVLGYNGTLPPPVAAWLGNAIFLAVGGTLLYRTPK